jgi:hypothetical protein
MNVEIETEAALFPEKEYIKGIFVAVQAVIRLVAENRLTRENTICGPAHQIFVY